MRSKLFSYFSPSASLANRLSAPQFLSLPSFPTTSSTTTPPLITSPPTLSPQAIPAIRPSIHSPGRVPLGEWTGAQKYRISELSDNTMRYLNERCKPYRSICSTAYKVLDAPELEDNFYLNLVDWGKHDKLTVGLKNSVYIYNVQTAVVDTLARVAPGESTGLYPAALKWIGDGTTLAWGNRRGDMDIYDVTTQKKIHTLDGHIKRIGVIDSTMGWLVASGSEDNTILVRDTRDAKHVVTKITAHNNEVCGLKFSAFDEPVLASGGNDNKLFIWDLRKMSPSSSDSPSGSSSGFTVRRGRLSTTPFSVLSQQQQPPMPTGSHDVLSLAGPSSAGAFGGNVVSKVPDSTANPGPLFHLSEHRAAVRGLAWSPHVRGLLASGGGRQDPIIRFWNTSLGYKIDQLQCHAQVTNLAWSSTTDELLSTHGFPHQAPPTGGQAAMPGVVTVWHYPTRVPNISFAAHNCRVSYLAVAPDGQGIATASGDETLRFFNLFPPKSEAENAMGAELVGRVR
ncbi:WD40 repeat-like protein [Clavulina sp. PMI_390]|nr:WD40 repeat-like protein [Clavulina sp. PMI_390]